MNCSLEVALKTFSAHKSEVAILMSSDMSHLFNRGSLEIFSYEPKSAQMKTIKEDHIYKRDN